MFNMLRCFKCFSIAMNYLEAGLMVGLKYLEYDDSMKRRLGSTA